MNLYSKRSKYFTNNLAKQNLSSEKYEEDPGLIIGKDKFY